MSAKIDGKNIFLTRGDTFRALITIKDTSGHDYTPSATDRIRFKVKKNYFDPDSETIINKSINVNTMILQLNPADTSGIDFGIYKYDIQLTTAAGLVDTIIPRGELHILEELDE